ncbi:exodeoxyribonuclease VII large subunit [Sulfurimonas sp. SAG-AH-194-I05]|nr:exodeoxyribonuclease VII large subunit [Sulfurimonas sp. SAG-AH-194-I05]MDF1875946.1 exodeoxyribonuclease VII large subunit [Sulfurimonas sp. SAG-AH-194-I05]
MYTLSVSDLNEQIKTLLETSFTRILVEGELSRITFHNSGHIYFTLKDSGSTLKAVMFRGNATKLKFQLKEGMKVILDGAITLYKPRGEYQINCFSIEPSGVGALALAYEQLKEKLSSKGYFDENAKKQLPSFPSKIALITSATGAALQDMLRVANTRYRALAIDVYDVLVQGTQASTTISNAIFIADKKDYDIIIVGRGGGSMEDLWAFNEENVADAIFDASTPIISAVGHEIDWVISDFVADVRAATPSIAMQICLQDSNELYQYLDSIASSFEQSMEQKMYTKGQELEYLHKAYAQHSIQRQLEQKKQDVLQLKEQYYQNIIFQMKHAENEITQIYTKFPHAIRNVLNSKTNQLQNLSRMLESNNPSLKSTTGFAQISQNKKVINIVDLHKGDVFDIQSDTVYLSAKVTKRILK